jgi:hypothetical protein
MFEKPVRGDLCGSLHDPLVAWAMIDNVYAMTHHDTAKMFVACCINNDSMGKNGQRKQNVPG